jgi:mRNA interferase HigB
MRIHRLNLLASFWESHPDVKTSLRAWSAEVEQASWKTPVDIKQRYGNADILPGNRVVFNIKGNHYRLVVEINYSKEIVEIRFVGTHAEYDRIDAIKI